MAQKLVELEDVPGGTLDDGVFYPESDGKRMAESDVQFDYIVLIKEGLEDLFRDDPNAYIAGDVLWYPVKDQTHMNAAPDTMVVLGRPKRKRKSYIQHLEGGIAPQVCFEIRSRSNSGSEMRAKRDFYERYGVEEYYMFDPERGVLQGWQRQAQKLNPIKVMQGWVSPRLGIRFELVNKELQLYNPNGESFINFVEARRRERLSQQRAERAESAYEVERRRAEREHRRAEIERQRAEDERVQAEIERKRAEQAEQEIVRLKALLQQASLNPDG